MSKTLSGDVPQQVGSVVLKFIEIEQTIKQTSKAYIWKWISERIKPCKNYLKSSQLLTFSPRQISLKLKLKSNNLNGLYPNNN